MIEDAGKQSRKIKYYLNARLKYLNFFLSESMDHGEMPGYTVLQRRNHFVAITFLMYQSRFSYLSLLMDLAKKSTDFITIIMNSTLLT